MMESVEETAGPMYRASQLTRGAAWVVLASTSAMALWAIATGRATPTKVLLVSAVFALLATAALRLEVRARPDHLVVCWGARVQRIPWSDIRGFEVDHQTGRDVFVVLGANRRQRLPLVDVATRKMPAAEPCEALKQYWRAHRSRG
jgi:hypothetical protein